VALLPHPTWAGPPNPGGGGGGSAATHRWYLPDHLGSSVLVAAGNGSVVQRRFFEPFGRIEAESQPTETTRQLFAGQELSPATGLYDFRARWYDPEIGRFLSVDPVIGELSAASAFGCAVRRGL
jgi:RHS repeat-associated protein